MFEVMRVIGELMNTKTIRQTVRIQATTKEVYEALMNSNKHSRFTGAKAAIKNRIGGAFSCYDGYITGINLELKPSILIVQAWRSLGWPNGHYSVVTFKLSEIGQRQTKLEFSQIGVPTKDVKAKSSGWGTHYWA